MVDQPEHGYGSTNDGNLEPRLFSNYEIFEEITGISKNLIYTLWIISMTLSSWLPINEKKFKMFTLKIAAFFLNRYSWYSMPTTVHIIQKDIVPIWLLWEGEQESKNKDIKNMVKFYHQVTILKLSPSRV